MRSEDRTQKGIAYIRVSRNTVGNRPFSFQVYNTRPMSNSTRSSVLIPVEFEIPESAFEPPNPMAKLKVVKEVIGEEQIIINVEEVNR